jgi:hypothetical protein
MPRVRADVTAVVVGRRVILVGGFDGVGPQRDVWATTNGRSFTVIAQLAQPVRYRRSPRSAPLSTSSAA